MGVDHEDAHVLVGHESSRKCLAEDPGEQRGAADDSYDQNRSADEHLGQVHILHGAHLEHLVEPAVELAEPPTGGLGRLEDLGAERRSQAQRQKRRDEHRNGDGQRELLVEPSG